MDDRRDEPPPPSAPAAAPALAQVMRFTRARWLRRTLATVVVLALVAWLAVPVAVRRIGEAQGSAALGRALRIGDAHFDPLTLDLRLDDVTLAGAHPGDPPAATIARLELDVDWRSLWARAPVLDAVRVEAPTVRIARTAAGHFDVDDLLERFARRPAAPKDDAPARFAVYNIQVERGRIEFDDRAVHDRHVVEALSLGVPFVSNLPGDVDVKVQPRLRFVLDGAHYDSLAEAVPFRSERNGRVELHTGEIALAPWLPYWPATLGWRPTQGRVKLDAALGFDVPPKGVPHATLSGDLAVDDLALVDAAAKPLVAWRSFALHVDELRPLERQAALGRVALTGLAVDVDRDAHGGLNLVHAFAGGAASAPAPAASSPAPEAAPWKVQARAIELADARIGWRDATVVPAAAFAVDGLQVRIEGARWPLPPGVATSAGSAASAAPAASAASTTSGDAVRVHLQGRWSALTAATAAASVPAAASAPADGRFAVDGGLGAQRSEVAARVEQWPLAPWRPYLAPVWKPATEGSLSAAATLRWDGAPGDVLPAITVSQASVDGLRLREAGRAAPVVAWQRVQVDDLAVDLAHRRVELASASLAQPEAWIERDAGGVLNATRWTAPAAATTSPAPAAASAAAPASTPGWQVHVGRAAIAGGRVHWRDAPAGGPVALDVDSLQAAVADFSWPAAPLATSHVTLAARFTPGNRSGSATAGRLDFDGRLGLAPVSWDGRLRAERVPLHVADAYLADASPLQLLHADAGWRGQVQGELADGGPRVHMRGDALLTDLHARARFAPDLGTAAAAAATTDDLVSWQSFSARGLELTLAPGRAPALVVGEATLVDAYARLVVTEQGRFNLTDLAPPAAASASAPAGGAVPVSVAVNVPVAASTPVPAAADPGLPDIRIGHVEWTNARIEYTDRFVRPNYSADLSAVSGTLGAFSSRTPELAPLQLKGRVAGTGVLDVQGQLNPLARPLALDVHARATDIELAPLSPYAGKYAGYAIERGKLSMDVRYKVAPDGRLEAGNQVTLNQLTFGDKVDSPSATKLPVLFAVALLKDRNGVIDVNLPIGGSINDPDFSVGGIVVKLIVNLLTKALTAPFALLSGGGQDDLSQVLFVPGTAQPAAGADKAFDQVAKALQDRPGLHLTITGLADDDQEHAALQAANLEARLAGLRSTELLQAGQAGAGAVALAPEDRARLVKRLYEDTKLPDKPRNVLGLAKDVPPAEMASRLAAGLPLPADAARQLAIARAIVVRDALATRGLPNERMFVASPKMHGAGSAEPEAWLPHAQLELSAR